MIDTAAGPAQLNRSKRKTLAISVLPDGTLHLAAPDNATGDAILAKVEKRRRWIQRQRQFFSEMNDTRPVLRYVNGATHRYLGRQYRLKITAGPVAKVVMEGGFLHVTAPEVDETAVKAALQSWFREHAQEHFIRRVSVWRDWCKHRHLAEPTAKLRTMPKRWGSTSSNGTIYLNPELIRTPSICIDYVIAHEICHLRHPNHDPKFYRLLSSLFPRWREVKNRLETAEF